MFADLEAGEDIGNKGNTGNKEREEEKKKEQEEYEKSVGYLTYLGQDTNELTGDKSWWQRIPEVSVNEKKNLQFGRDKICSLTKVHHSCIEQSV